MNLAQRIAFRMMPREFRDGVTSIGGVSEYLKWLHKNQGKTYAGVKVTENTALGLSYAYSCIKVLAETAGHIPFRLMRKVDKRNNEPAVDHPLFDLVTSSPSQYYTSTVFRETLEGHRNGWGNCYGKIIRPAFMSTEVDSIEILYPDRTRPRLLDDGITLVYETTTMDGQKEVIPSADIIHIHGMGYSGLIGYSPIALLKEAFGLGLAAQQVGNSILGSGLQPSMVIETSGASHNKENLRHELESKFSGVENVGNALVLPKGATAKAISIKPEDAQFLQSRQFNRTEIAGIYRVPPHFIGDLDKNTFTNAASMDLNFVKHTMIPIFRKWEAEFNRKLLTAKERKEYFFQFNVNGILRGSPDERKEFYHSAINNGWMTRNQVREKEDLPIDDESLDQYLLPVNMVPVSDMDMEPVIESVSYRLSKYLTKGLKDSGKPEAVLEFVETHVGLAEDIIRPLSKAFRMGEGFVSYFGQKYRSFILKIELNKIEESSKPDIITRYFYEVLNEYRKTHNNA